MIFPLCDTLNVEWKEIVGERKQRKDSPVKVNSKTMKEKRREVRI
jgi:hypothetical protein